MRNIVGLFIFVLCSVIIAVAAAGYIGYSAGHLAATRSLDEEAWKREWVAVVMRPLWNDMCRAMPEKCNCEPKGEGR